MARYCIATNLDEKKVMSTARDVALNLGFSVSRKTDWEFEARKGNVLVGIFLGALLPYCRFQVAVAPGWNNTVEISITHNTPRLTSGALGVRGVKSRAKELADGIEAAIRQQGGDIVKRSES